MNFNLDDFIEILNNGLKKYITKNSNLKRKRVQNKN